MRSQVPPVCAHCQSTKSPLWRRGSNMEVLCNACGLYWKHHNAYRPLALKAAADRKNTVMSSGEGQRVHSDGSTSTHPLAYTNPQISHFYVNYNNRSSIENHDDQYNSRKAGPMRSSNILLYPGQFNQPGSHVRSVDSKRVNENILPPLDYKNRSLFNGLSTSNPLANKRQLNAALVLPNLKSVLESISGENVPSTSTMSSNVPKINNSPKPADPCVNQSTVAQTTPPVPSLIGNSSQYVNPKYSGHYYHPQQQQFNLNAPIKFIINRGTTIYQGDHVSIRGSDSQIYFAVLMDFWLTENGKRYCTLRWLLPKPKASFTSALQNRFDLGPVHERVEAMETILDIFYSPYRDQMTAENIRKMFLLSPSVASGSEDTDNSGTGNKKQSGGIVTIDPPSQLLKAIKSLSENGDGQDHESIKSIRTPAFSADNLLLSSHSDSPSSLFFKSSPSDEIQMNPIISAESSEIAAKMLLSMN